MTTDEHPLRDETRERVWTELREVARPDSRFGWDFSSFIADYEGSDACADRLLDRAESEGYKQWFITPDNNLDPLRERLIRRDRGFMMPSYGIRRGFLQLDPDAVPGGLEPFAATLDGMNRYAPPIELVTMAAEMEPMDCMITGASFVTRDGLRMGKGHGFFDLEWAMLRAIGLAGTETDVVAVVHEVQLLDDVKGQEMAAEHDTIVDAIVTPDRVLEIEGRPSKPAGIHWEMLSRGEVERMPPLRTLWKRAGEPALGDPD